MSSFSRKLGLAFGLATLCLGGHAAYGQAAPVRYWTSGWPFGFGGIAVGGQSANPYGNFSSFDGSDVATRYTSPNGWFVGGEGGSLGSSMNSINPYTAFGNFGSLSYQGAQA